MSDRSYEEICDSLQDLPATWYPGLLTILVKECERAGVFQPGGLQRFVANLVVPGPPNPPKGPKPTEWA